MKTESTKHFQLDKQSSDNSGAFIWFAKAEFGKCLFSSAVFVAGKLHFPVYIFPQFYWNFPISDLIIMVCTAISWKKKKFRSKFIHKPNYIEFTKLTTRLQDAHTTQLAM